MSKNKENILAAWIPTVIVPNLFHPVNFLRQTVCHPVDLVLPDLQAQQAARSLLPPSKSFAVRQSFNGFAEPAW